MTPLVEALTNVRWGRHALLWGAVDAARVHVDCARHWLIRGYDGSARADRVLGHVNRLALDVLFAEVAGAPLGAGGVA